MPVVFTAAIDRGYTPVSIMLDEPVTFDGPPGMPPYSPENDDGTYKGETTLRQALEGSRNVVAVKLTDQVGTGAVLSYAAQLGLRGDHGSRLPMAAELEANLVEMTSVYATLANQGIRMVPHAIVSVANRDGFVVEENRPKPEEGVRADTAFVITSLLSGVIERGTGAAARSLDWPLAGKTGTVPDGTDGWFVGFDPNITVGVWVGRDDQRPIGTKEAATSAALSIWTEFMRAYVQPGATRPGASGT